MGYDEDCDEEDDDEDEDEDDEECDPWYDEDCEEEDDDDEEGDPDYDDCDDEDDEDEDDDCWFWDNCEDDDDEEECDPDFEDCEEECDPFWENCDDDDEDECDPMFDDCEDDDDDWWNEDDEEEEDECVPVCTDPFHCPDSPFEMCFMTECHCEGGDENDSHCRAEWTDMDGHEHMADCEDYHHFEECMDYDHSMDDCKFAECDDQGNCWEEICNEDSEDMCAEMTCTIWKYDQRKDYWEQHECPRDQKDFEDHFHWFYGHFGGTFKMWVNETCPHGHCFENFTDDYIPFFDENDEAIDAFLDDEEAVDIAHEFVEKTEDALEDLGIDVELNPIHGLLEQDDHEDVKDAIDSWMTMWTQGWMNNGLMRKGERSD